MNNTSFGKYTTRVRALMLASAIAFANMTIPAAEAHHGWGHYDTGKPLLFTGRIVAMNYSNPHPEVTIVVSEGATLDPSTLPVPEELTALGFADVISTATMAPAGQWTLDLAPIGQLERWGMPRPPEIGDTVQAVGFPACHEEGVARPNLFVINGIGVRQQSVALPTGCSGEPRG